LIITDSGTASVFLLAERNHRCANGVAVDALVLAGEAVTVPAEGLSERVQYRVDGVAGQAARLVLPGERRHRVGLAKLSEVRQQSGRDREQPQPSSVDVRH